MNGMPELFTETSISRSKQSTSKNVAPARVTKYTTKRKTINKVMIRAGWPLILAAGIAVCSTAPAHADSQDDQFLAAVSALGINGDPGPLTNAGRSICDSVGTPAAIPVFFGLQAQEGLTPPQVSNVLMAGVRSYCPEKASQVAPLPRMAP
jgi:hypothetical protein